MDDWQEVLSRAAETIRQWGENVDESLVDEYWRIAYDLDGLSELSTMDDWAVDDFSENPESEPESDGADSGAGPVERCRQEADESENQQDQCEGLHALSVKD